MLYLFASKTSVNEKSFVLKIRYLIFLSKVLIKIITSLQPGFFAFKLS